MENITEAIEIWNNRRILRNECFARNDDHHDKEYNDLMETLRLMKDETTCCKEDISKNFQFLMTQEHSIYKLIHDCKNVQGLPVSHDVHRQARGLLSEGIEFINNLQSFDMDHANTDQTNIHASTNHLNDVIVCTEAVAKEIYKVKSCINKVEALRKAANRLEEQSFIIND